jgi:hypothetical protein
MKNADIPAMPVIAEYMPDGKPKTTFVGLTKRELFAAMAMQGILSSGQSVHYVAGAAIDYAEALLAALEQKPQTTSGGGE